MAQVKISELAAAITPLGGTELLEAVQSGANRKVTLSDVWMVRDTAENFETNNPTPAAGQTYYETDTGLFKFGDGVTAYNDLDYAAALSSGGGGMEIGTIFPYAGTVAPVGSLLCDGSAISRTEYADLFAAIGTTWGVGDGSTTFNVPDLRGAFVRGTGSHGTETMANGNPFAGPSVGAFEDDQFQGHHHVMRTENGSAVNGTPTSTGYPARFDIDGRQQVSNVYDSVNQVVIQQASEDPTFGADRDGDETRPFAAGVTYCIKATPATNSGTPLPTYSYSTGWVANSDWTNAEFTVTHGLNAPLSDLVVEFLVSTDGTEENSFQVAQQADLNERGLTAYAVNSSSFKLQTGTNGIFVTGDGSLIGTSGGDFTLNTQPYYYKVKVYRPEVLATELSVTKYDTGWTGPRTDWTNVDLSVVHNLGASLPDLIVKFFLSSDGTDANAVEMVGYQGMDAVSAASRNYGVQASQVSENELSLQTGAQGLAFLTEAGGFDPIDNDSYYWRVVVYAPNLLENVTPAAVKSVSSDYTITGRTDSPTIQVTTGASNITVTLPAGTSMIPGDIIKVLKLDSGAGSVDVTCAGSDTLDWVGPSTTVSLYSEGNNVTLQWDGSQWAILSLTCKGSNSNGDYVVFSTGLQACWFAIPSGSADGGSGATSYRHSGTLPQAFASGTTPFPAAVERQGSSFVRNYDISMNTSATSWDMYTSVDPLAYPVSVIVIGEAG